MSTRAYTRVNFCLYSILLLLLVLLFGTILKLKLSPHNIHTVAKDDDKIQTAD